MRLTLQDKRKKKLGVGRFFKSFTYNYEGLKYALLNEQSILVQLICAIIVIVLGFVFHLTKIEWIIIIIVIGLVLAFEFVNTAIEAVVDLASPGKHALAKIAKDTASTAVGIMALVSLIIGIIIFLPKIINLF